MFCRAAGDLQLRLCSVPKMASRNSGLYLSSYGNSHTSGNELSPTSKASQQQPGSSRRRRATSDASRFAAEAASQAGADGTSGTNMASQQQQQHSSRPAGQGFAVDAAADGPRVSPFAAAQQQVRKQPSGAAMNGDAGGRQESRAWRQLQRASMQQELHDRQRQQQQQQQQVHDSHQV